MLRSIAVALAACLLLASSADAQLVRIGPWGGVSVRAPFVRVRVGAFGSTYVRAPFTRVYAPAPVYFPPVVAYPPKPVYQPFVPVVPIVPVIPTHPYLDAPPELQTDGRYLASPYERRLLDPDLQSSTSAAKLPIADPERVLSQLRAAALRLERGLANRRDDGEIWLEYLAPNQIISAIDEGLPFSEFAELMQRYDGVMANPELRWVAGVNGFSDTREWLRELVDLGEFVSPAFAPDDSAIESEPEPLERLELPAPDTDASERLDVPPPPVDESGKTPAAVKKTYSL